MMMIFGACLILGALIDIFLATFSFSHLLIIALGAGLIVVNFVGGKIKIFRGIGKSIVSLLAIGLVVFIMTGVSGEADFIDKDVADIIKEANNLFEEKGIETAVKHLEDKNIDLGWNKAFAMRIAELYAIEEMYPESAGVYGNVLSKLPDDLDVRLVYANALYLSGDYNGAHREATYIAKIDPEYADAYVLMGDLYQAWNDHFREKYYYKIAVGLDETSVLYRVRLAEAYGRTHSYEEAVSEYELAKQYAKTFDEESIVYESYLRFADADSQEN